MSNILEFHEVAKSYGGVEVFRSIDLEVKTGERLGILGPNGAGKSTLFNLISGLTRPNKGKILFAGHEVGKMRPWAVCRSGIGRTFQIPQPFSDMTVLENLLVGLTNGANMSMREARSRGAEALEATGLAYVSKNTAGELSLLDLKRLELARAVALKPRLLLLDEIAGGLTEVECDTLLDILANVTDSTMTVIWIEHVVHALTRYVNEIAVLADKRIITRGGIDNVLAHPEVRELYFGSTEEV
ncbi:MAG: ABC transporter ATP-binding protein [Rhodobacteraceae bacterium]|nr:MAG: ABC transporter ATP-binding protein [Paracoccaceae bacterium]